MIGGGGGAARGACSEACGRGNRLAIGARRIWLEIILRLAAPGGANETSSRGNRIKYLATSNHRAVVVLGWWLTVAEGDESGWRALARACCRM